MQKNIIKINGHILKMSSHNHMNIHDLRLSFSSREYIFKLQHNN